MANLYDLLMAKERGNIEGAPNTQRIGQAPLNLRSAMKYARGGITDSDIASYVQSNIGNPAAIAEAAQQYQVTAEDLARATGYGPREIAAYFSSAGVSGPYREPESREEPVPPPPPLPPAQPGYRQNPPPPEEDRSNMEAEKRAQEIENMKRQREAEEYYFKMRNLQNPPTLPPQPAYNQDPGFAPMPIEAAYPPGYFDPQPTPPPTNIGYPLAPPPPNMQGGPVQTPPSTGLLGSLGYGGGLGSSGQSSPTQSIGGLGAGLPGQGMQGTGQSLDSLINYLATQRKKA